MPFLKNCKYMAVKATENQVSGLPQGSADTTNGHTVTICDTDVSHSNLPTSDTTTSTLKLGVRIRILLLYKTLFLFLKLFEFRKTPFPMIWKILPSCTYSPSRSNTWVPTPPRRTVPFFNTLVFQILVLRIEYKPHSSNPRSAEILSFLAWHVGWHTGLAKCPLPSGPLKAVVV